MDYDETNRSRIERGRDFAARMFSAGGTRVQAPAEIDGEWRRFLAASVVGDVWARPGLGLRDRSIVTNSVLIALGRSDELAIHLESARHIGLSREELCEVIWHAGVYAGFPASNHAFHLAARLFDQEDADALPRESSDDDRGKTE